MTDSQVRELGDELHEIVARVDDVNVPDQVTMTDAARELWGRQGDGLYGLLKTKARPGMLEAICGRATPQVIRIASIYALLDYERGGLQAQAVKRDVDHLKAAAAIWNYCEDSAAYLFGNSTGNQTADTILDALKTRGRQGMTRTEIYNMFGRHTHGGAIQDALAELLKLGLVRMESKRGSGRPLETWFAV